MFTALSNLNGDKAPGPDGYKMVFWQFSWDIVKDDIMRMLEEFFETEKFVKNLKTTFLVLVPKKGGAEDFKDFKSGGKFIQAFNKGPCKQAEKGNAQTDK